MADPVIQVQQGQLRGIWENNIYGVKFVAFRGIPYAKPPVGDLRFKDPEPVEPWSGIKDATKFGNKCMQRDWITKEIIGKEDGLYLNVYTSDLNPSAPRAVMVWIHGGGFIFGSGDDDFYGPDYFIERDVVLVTINYRVGVLGFLNADDEEAPGNQGLKDQVLALKWVQQNISRFGGDPHNVTIFGESAGGASVHYLTISPLAQGLFHKAILQSGVAINPWASSACSPKETAFKLSSILGNEITDPKKLVKFLKTVDAHQLIDAEKSLQTWQDKWLFIWPFGPSVDEKSKNPFLSVPVQDAAKSGIKVPCILGYTDSEGILALAEVNKDKFADLEANQENLLFHPTMKKMLKEKNITVDQFKKLFMGDVKIAPENAQNMVDLLSAVHFIIGIHQTLQIQNRISHVPAYLYKFEYESPKSLMNHFLQVDLKGTCHGEEIQYMFYPHLLKTFGMPQPTLGSTESLITHRFIELWTNFAKTGNPTPTPSEITPIDWKPINDSIEYNCLKISEDVSIIKETNIMHEIEMKMKKNKL
ncbi:esterase FE4-like [Chelonus insularis]|uniref:esterase FE4-like n=1 Tax=Chelonus insularis TaxID=460826 RepID=UPI00158ED502|nr:esterase FE4-like [Chelonus insularis]